MKSPAFQFYPGDFLSDLNVIVMTTQEVGAYALLMSICWQEDGLPDDIEELADATRMEVGAFKTAWERRVKRCFALREDGRWDHPRLQAERIKQQEFSRKMSESATRRHHPDRQPLQKIRTKKAMPTHQEGNALQSLSSSPSPNTASPNGGWPCEAAEVWKAVAPIPIPRLGKALKPVVDEYGWPDTKAGLLCYIELNEGRARDPQWFANDSVRWIRLGKQGLVDPNTGAFTERGKLAEQVVRRTA